MNLIFLSNVERILWLYTLPVDEEFPVVCFDERPCFLIGETVNAIEMKGASRRKRIFHIRRMVLVLYWRQSSH